MSFLCLWFVVHIDLLNANGDVGGLRRRWWATFLLSQGLCFSFISCKCVVVSLKSYLDSIYSHKFNIIYLVCVWIPLILLKIENNKKIYFDYCSLMNLLFIGLIALFMSHEQCTKRWSQKKKKKAKNTQNADVGSTFALPKCTFKETPIIFFS